MKMIYFTFPILILFAFACKTDDKSPLSHQDFTFKIEFYPSFIESSRIVLQKKGNIEKLSISLIYGQDYNLKDRKNVMIENVNNLLFNCFIFQSHSDSIFLKPIEEVIIRENDFNQFKNGISKIDLQHYKSTIDQPSIDGIRIYFSFKTDTIDNQFCFRSPEKSDSLEYSLILSLFEIIENSFKNDTTIEYIERLKGYFNFGLLVKKISEDPLEYRFYGHISSNEAMEFYRFIKKVPKNRTIIFDFSNLSGMGSMFYPSLERLISKNSKIYWIVNDYTIKYTNYIGVNPNKIFKNRSELIDKIRNAP